MNVLRMSFIDELIDFEVSQKEVIIIIEIISQQVLARADKKGIDIS